MSHGIEENDNLAYTGQVPWHGIGTALTAGADLDTWIVESGLNYTVKTAKVGYLAGDTPKVIDDRRVMYRDDSGDWLEVVSNDYHVHQPHEIMEFYRDLTERDGFTMEVAGSMRNGRRIWALAKSPDSFEIYGDKIKQYMLASTGFTGGESSQFIDTNIRVVCNNTFSAAMCVDGKRATRQTHRGDLDIEGIKVKLGLSVDQRELLIQSLKALADTTVTGDEKARFVLDMVHPGATKEKIQEVMTKPNKPMEMLFRTLNKGVGQEGISDTMYGLFNGVTRYQDHERRQRGEGSRLESAWFGPGANLKNAAWDWCVKQCVEKHNVNESVFLKAA